MPSTQKSQTNDKTLAVVQAAGWPEGEKSVLIARQIDALLAKHFWPTKKVEWLIGLDDPSIAGKLGRGDAPVSAGESEAVSSPKTMRGPGVSRYTAYPCCAHCRHPGEQHKHRSPCAECAESQLENARMVSK